MRRLDLRTIAERVRDNQFLIPLLCILLSFALVTTTNELDERNIGHPLAIASAVPATRTLLATIAGAIITVAALVFSLSAVTTQLAATQFSPRVVQGFLRDRRQQVTFGIAMGTFTYALGALATLPTDLSGATQADWTATTAVTLAVLTAVVIVAFIDHVMREVRIDDAVKRLSEATQAAYEDRTVQEQARTAVESLDLPSDVHSHTLRAERSGYVQEVDVTGLVAVLPPGVVVRLDVWVGDFVVTGRRLMTAWNAERQRLVDLVDYITIGERRSIEQDPEFGIRQLIDIALRALSPGVNDPATAADVVRHLSACLRAAYLYGEPNRIQHGEGGARVVAPRARSADNVVDGALTSIWRAAQDQPLVLSAISDAARGLDDDLGEQGFDTSALERAVTAAENRMAEIEAADEEARLPRND